MLVAVVPVILFPTATLGIVALVRVSVLPARVGIILTPVESVNLAPPLLLAVLAVLVTFWESPLAVLVLLVTI
jgi:hypothetical protein